MKTNNEFKYNSKEKLIRDFISLFRDQYEERQTFIADFTAKNNIDPELPQSHWPGDLENQFYTQFLRAKLPGWTKYNAFMHGIPFEDLVMIERLIGHHDFLVENDLILYDQDNPQSTNYITKDQRWTVIQYINKEVLKTAEIAEDNLALLKETYPYEIEGILTLLVPIEFRETNL